MKTKQVDIHWKRIFHFDQSVRIRMPWLYPVKKIEYHPSKIGVFHEVANEKGTFGKSSTTDGQLITYKFTWNHKNIRIIEEYSN